MPSQYWKCLQTLSFYAIFTNLFQLNKYDPYHGKLFYGLLFVLAMIHCVLKLDQVEFKFLNRDCFVRGGQSSLKLLTYVNEWYPRGLQISLHIWSPGLQDYSEVWNLKFFWFGGGGGILKLMDLDSDNFHGGGYSETLRFWLSDNFFFLGGILKLGFGLSDNFHLGEYSETLGFGISDNFHGGVFWNSRIWTLWQFSFGGYSVLQNRGILSEFGPKFQPLQQAHASQIVSHILRMWRLISGGKKATSSCLVGGGWPHLTRQSEVAFAWTLFGKSNSAVQDSLGWLIGLSLKAISKCTLWEKWVIYGREWTRWHWSYLLSWNKFVKIV